MNVRREDHGRGVLLVVEGQVDMHTSPELRRHLRQALAARSTPIVTDLTEVSFIDSSGLATLIEALQGVGQYGGELRLAGLQPVVRNLFQLSNLSTIFQIHETRADALGA